MTITKFCVRLKDINKVWHSKLVCLIYLNSFKFNLNVQSTKEDILTFTEEFHTFKEKIKFWSNEIFPNTSASSKCLNIKKINSLSLGINKEKTLITVFQI